MQKYINDIIGTSGSSLSPITGATCSVYLTGTSTLATLYSDNGVTPKANPISSSSTGRIEFYAADGRYDISVVKSEYTTVTLADILLEDLADATPGAFTTLSATGGVSVPNDQVYQFGGAGTTYIQGNAATPVVNVVVGGALRGAFSSTGLNSTAIGATTPSTGAFTTVTASGLLDGANFTIGNGGGAYFGLVNDALGRGSANYAIQQGSAGNTIVGAPSGQTVTQAVNDVAITVASSTGLAVTGTLSSTLDATIYGLTVGRGGGAVSNNTAVGVSALSGANTGGENTALGYAAALTSTTASYVTAVGSQAARFNNAIETTAIGALSLYNNTSGTYNTGVGYAAGGFGTTTGTNGTYIGNRAGYYANNTGSTAVGALAMQGTGSGAGAGNYNTAIGHLSLYGATTGASNCCVGYNSGSSISSGSNNVIIGSYSGSGSPISNTGTSFVVLSDGGANIVAHTKSGQTFALQGGTLSAGTGIAFPATQSASTDANTLDDYREATATLTATGMTTSPTGTATFVKIGNAVTMELPAISGTSNATTFTLTGIPSAFRPTATRTVFGLRCADNATTLTAAAPMGFIGSDGVVTLYTNAGGGAWTNTGTKTISTSNISYLI